MMVVELDSMEREHIEWLRAEAVKIAFQLHKYAPKLDEVLVDAEAVFGFITQGRATPTPPSAEVIPMSLVPRDGGDAA